MEIPDLKFSRASASQWLYWFDMDACISNQEWLFRFLMQNLFEILTLQLFNVFVTEEDFD